MASSLRGAETVSSSSPNSATLPPGPPSQSRASASSSLVSLCKDELTDDRDSDMKDKDRFVIKERVTGGASMKDLEGQTEVTSRLLFDAFPSPPSAGRVSSDAVFETGSNIIEDPISRVQGAKNKQFEFVHVRDVTRVREQLSRQDENEKTDEEKNNDEGEKNILIQGGILNKGIREQRVEGRLRKGEEKQMKKKKRRRSVSGRAAASVSAAAAAAKSSLLGLRDWGRRKDDGRLLGGREESMTVNKVSRRSRVVVADGRWRVAQARARAARFTARGRRPRTLRTRERKTSAEGTSSGADRVPPEEEVSSPPYHSLAYNYNDNNNNNNNNSNDNKPSIPSATVNHDGCVPPVSSAVSVFERPPTWHYDDRTATCQRCKIAFSSRYSISGASALLLEGARVMREWGQDAWGTAAVPSGRRKRDAGAGKGVRWRHHCRHCGGCFCTQCAHCFLPIPKFGFFRPVRVCVSCADLLSSSAVTLEEEEGSAERRGGKEHAIIREESDAEEDTKKDAEEEEEEEEDEEEEEWGEAATSALCDISRSRLRMTSMADVAALHQSGLLSASDFKGFAGREQRKKKNDKMEEKEEKKAGTGILSGTKTQEEPKMVNSNGNNNYNYNRINYEKKHKKKEGDKKGGSGSTGEVLPHRIVILTVGSRGDVQPFLALALALQQRGHHVRLASHRCFRSFVESHGVEFYPLAGDPKRLMALMSQHPLFSLQFVLRGTLKVTSTQQATLVKGSDIRH